MDDFEQPIIRLSLKKVYKMYMDVTQNSYLVIGRRSAGWQADYIFRYYAIPPRQYINYLIYPATTIQSVAPTADKREGALYHLWTGVTFLFCTNGNMNTYTPLSPSVLYAEVGRVLERRPRLRRLRQFSSSLSLLLGRS